jgi:hypothetical protein
VKRRGVREDVALGKRAGLGVAVTQTGDSVVQKPSTGPNSEAN